MREVSVIVSAHPSIRYVSLHLRLNLLDQNQPNLFNDLLTQMECKNSFMPPNDLVVEIKGYARCQSMILDIAS